MWADSVVSAVTSSAKVRGASRPARGGGSTDDATRELAFPRPVATPNERLNRGLGGNAVGANLRRRNLAQ